MRMSVFERQNVTDLDEFLLNDLGHLRVRSAIELRQIPHGKLRYWAHENAVYQFPTAELIEWLRGRIGNRRAIEICAGNGSIGRALHIPITDSYIQMDQPMRLFYQAMGQPVTEPPADVQRLEANAAVEVFQPQVVIAAWPTQVFREEGQEGSIWGVNEEYLLDQPSVREYIVIGNMEVHRHKRILHRPHETYQYDWLVSRAINPEYNAIWIWKR